MVAVRIVFRSPGILTIIDGPEQSSLFPFVLYHVGFHVPTLSLNTELAVAIFHDVIAYQAGCRRTDSVSILVYLAQY